MDDDGADQARRMAQQAAEAAADASRRASESHERFKQIYQESLRSQRQYQQEPTARPRNFARTGIQAVVAIVVVLLGVSYLFGGQGREEETSRPKGNVPVVPGRNDTPSTGRPDKDAPKMLVMPDVVGESNVNSAILMSRAGFDHQNVLMDSVPAPRDQFGRVVRTSPKPGKKVRSDAIVRLYIGRGGP